MSLLVTARSKPPSWNISVGAEGIAAAQFARCGFDVLIQAGHDKPWYDLAITKAGNLLKVAVKGSEDGRWSLAHSYMKQPGNLCGKKTDAHRAIDLWLDIHGSRTIYCLVQFEGVVLGQLPRIYLATPHEIARGMRESAEWLGDPILHEHSESIPPNADYTSIEGLPTDWLFSQERIHELMFRQIANEVSGPPVRKKPAIEIRPATTDSALNVREVVLSA